MTVPQVLSSAEVRNPLSEADERDKLRRTIEIADEIWKSERSIIMRLIRFVIFPYQSTQRPRRVTWIKKSAVVVRQPNWAMNPYAAKRSTDVEAPHSLPQAGSST